MNKKNFIVFSLFSLILIISAIMVMGIGTNDVRLSSPTNASWSNNADKDANDFTFNWSELVTQPATTANCTLYINTSPTGIIDPANARNKSIDVPNSTNTIITPNASFTRNSINYWTVLCFSSNSTPQSWYPATRVLYIDNDTTPNMTINSYSFTNNTWNNTQTHWWNYTITDQGQLRGAQLTISLENASGSVYTSDLVDNDTRARITYTFSDGNYTIFVNGTDPAGNTNYSGNFFIAIDSTSPVISFVDPTPSNDTSQSTTHVFVNFSIVEEYTETVYLEWDSTTNYTVTGSNLSITSGSGYGIYNVTPIGDKKDIKYRVFVNDSASNIGWSDYRYVSVDTTSPVIIEAYNWTYSNSAANFIIRTNDTTASTATAKIFDRDGTLQSTITATLSATTVNGDTNFTGTIYGDNISRDGAFRVEYNITDELGNSVQENKTGMYTTLYDGWNLIGYAGANESAEGKETYVICADTQYCTQMSSFNNSHGAKSFTTYSTSTPSVNNGTRIQPGDAVHIYVSTDSYIISKDERPLAGDSTGAVIENVTLATGGWNTVGLITAANITGVWNATNMSSAVQPITYVSYINQSAETYYTCRKSIELCAGTSRLPTNLQLYEGWAVWVLTNVNATLNRSTIS